MDEMQKQLRPTKPKEIVVGFNKQSSLNHGRLVMAFQTHLRYDKLQFGSYSHNHLQNNIQLFLHPCN